MNARVAGILRHRVLSAVMLFGFFASVDSRPASAQGPTLLVADHGNGSIREFDSAGTFLRYRVEPGAGGLVIPSYFVTGPDGNLYVIDCAASHRNVKRY